MRRRLLAFAFVAACAAAALAVVSFSSARGGTDANPCPHPGPNLTGTETGAAGRPYVWLVCEAPEHLGKLETRYVPSVAGLAACPVGTYVVGGHAGLVNAEWDYAAGNSNSPVPSGLTSVVTWGGIVYRWEKDGRWTGGVAPLLTNWGEPNAAFRSLWVQVWFYCAPPNLAASRTAAAGAAQGCAFGKVAPPPA